jgi:hypothetical protein
MSKQLIQPAHTHAVRPAAQQPAESTTHPLLSLQQQVGNAQVARMLAQPQRDAEEDELMAKRDPAIQREGEEDELMAKRDPAIQREGEEDELMAKRDPAIQREGEEDELMTKRDPAIQRTAATDMPEVGPEGGPVSADVQSQIQSMRGGGAALDESVRGQMEQSFGDSFQDVRIHTNSSAAHVSRKIGALAFTTGSDIFFGANASPQNTELLAHELTHVVQQRGTSTNGPLTVGPANDHAEQAADAMASQVTSAPPVSRKEAD